MLLSDTLGIDCAYDDCYLHSRYYFAAIFISLFSLNILEIIKPRLQFFLQTGKCEPNKKKHYVEEVNLSTSKQPKTKKSKHDYLLDKDEQFRNNPF